MRKFLLNLAVILAFLLLIVLTPLVEDDYIAAFAPTAPFVEPEDRPYAAAGRLLVFLNLWAAFFYVNAGLYRWPSGPDLLLSGPAISSALLAAVVFLSCAYLFFILLWMIPGLLPLGGLY